MSGPTVHTRSEALQLVDIALQRFDHQLDGVTATARSGFAAIIVEIEQVRSQRLRDLQLAEAALARAPDEAKAQCQAAVQAAAILVERANRSLAQAREASGLHERAARRASAATDEIVSRARNELASMGDAVDRYQASSRAMGALGAAAIGGAGGAGPSGGAAVDGSSEGEPSAGEGNDDGSAAVAALGGVALAGAGAPSGEGGGFDTIAALGRVATAGADAASGADDSASAGAGTPLGRALAAHGVESVDVHVPDYADNPVIDYSKASPSDYRWAVEKWDSVISPGLATGRTREDFEAMDAASGAGDMRRLAMVHDLMLGDPILLSRLPDGTVSVTGGRHRLDAAKDLGVTSLPARFV